MDSPGTNAPPVVAVVVVHQPGPDFDEVLTGLARQQYPNLNTLFLITSEPGDLPTTIKNRLPDAFVRAVPENPGFGPTANEALRLVEGSGFFCFLHDDVALDPDAIATLMEELYRSNAGIVGPKLVDWDRPEVLQHVGMEVDRFGEVDPLVEPGEVDQEQHDAVRDVFAIPSACLLIRADLFRTLGGFHPGYAFHGEDVELCWRTHLSGARVLVVPAARARHRERLVERRPDLRHKTLAASHRADTVATLTTRSRLPLLMIQRVVLAIIETFVGLFSRRAKGGVLALGATLGTLGRLPAIVSRRKLIRPIRLVPAHEIAGLQLRGSARLSRFLRRRGQQHAAATARDRQLNAPAAPAAAWALVIVLFLIGSRRLISAGVPRIGQFTDLQPGSDLLRTYFSGWNPQGFGGTAALPTGVALVGLVTKLLGTGGLLRLLLVLSPIVLGYVGAWRMASFFPSARARIAALLVYAAVPLPYAALAGGRWGVLIGYGAMPWVVEMLRQASGLWVAGSTWGDDDISDIVTPVGTGRRVRLAAALGLLCGVVGAFEPTFPLLVVIVALALVVGTLLARGSLTVLAGLVTATAAVIVAGLLNLPWSGSFVRAGGWSDIVGSTEAPASNFGLLDVASFRIGPSVLAWLAVGLYLPVLAAPIIGRGWRLTWASRSGALVAAFLALAVVGDRGSLPFRLPETGLLMAPVACGLALSAACAIAGFEHDIRGATFGWRQPLGLVVGLALLAGLVPGLAAATNGHWSAPQFGLSSYLRQLPPESNVDPARAGDYRVLFIGAPHDLPAPSRVLYPGVGWMVADDGPFGMEDLWLSESGDADRLAVEALEAIAAVSTTRAGRLLGPLGVRYIVVPTGSDSGVESVPEGLGDALSSQLDLRLVASPDQLIVYENTSWLPVRSVLDAEAVTASAEAGTAALATRSLGRGNGVLIGQDPPNVAMGGPSVPGVLNLSYLNDGGWRVSADGAIIAARPSFGWSTAFDLPQATTVTVERVPASGRHLAVGIQILCWLLALATILLAGRTTWIRGSRRVPLGGVVDPLLVLADVETPPAQLRELDEMGAPSIIGEPSDNRPLDEIRAPSIIGEPSENRALEEIGEPAEMSAPPLAEPENEQS